MKGNKENVGTVPFSVDEQTAMGKDVAKTSRPTVSLN